MAQDPVQFTLWDRTVTVGEPEVVGTLQVFPLLGTDSGSPPYLTAPEALAAGLLQVHELDPPQVPFLAVNNLADVPVLLVEGETLIGGNQNRILNVTVLCPPGRTVVPVACVEAGRWGARREMRSSGRHAPGSLRAAKTASLTAPGNELRLSDQGRVWAEVDRQSARHQLESPTDALADVQSAAEDEVADHLSRLRSHPDQLGVACTAGATVLGLDLFDRPATLDCYLESIVAGHVLDRDLAAPGDPAAALDRFLARLVGAPVEEGPAVGLGREVQLGGSLAGTGLRHDGRLVHLAAFPATS
jgi:hypothetical protein